MKRSAWVASLIIFLFFLFFNGLQVYLIKERISETKNKFGGDVTSALLTTIGDYNKLKAIDSASTPTDAWISYSQKVIQMTRIDSHTVKFMAPFSPMVIDTVEPGVVESIVNIPVFRTIDLKSFDSIFHHALLAKKINAGYRLDTITMRGKKINRQAIPIMWGKKRSKEYQYSTGPMRMPFNSNIFIFAQLKNDRAYVRNDLLWPLISFGLILLIGNAALVFVYKTIRRQKRINEVKTDFINNITHEMKTPITIASAGLDALERQVSPTERTKFYVDTSKRQLHLLNEFVERILEAAVRDVSDFTLKKEKIDLHALFEEMIQSHSVLQAKTVGFLLTAEGPIYIQGDRLHLETAFHNIIDNAIKYSNGSVEIYIDIVENSRDCSIKIRDNGMGIPPQFIKSVFEKFFRVPQGDAQSIKGFGLGLYYVNNIVKKHSGTITVHSKQQQGTEFIITLPKHS